MVTQKRGGSMENEELNKALKKGPRFCRVGSAGSLDPGAFKIIVRRHKVGNWVWYIDQEGYYWERAELVPRAEIEKYLGD